MIGYIDSIETMSFNDGPGIRIVISFNKKNSQLELTTTQLVDRIRKFRSYIGPNNGGVTFIGDDLLEQIDYLIDVTKLCHKAGINTCIETNGMQYEEEKLDALFNNIDVILFKIESLPLYNYNDIEITELMNAKKFIDIANKFNINIWIKQIIKRDVNDNERYFKVLKKYLGMIDNIADIELIMQDLSDEEMLRVQTLFNEV